MTIEETLAALQAEQKTFHEKGAAETKMHGTILEDTKNTINKMQTQLDALDVKLAEKHIQQAAAPGSCILKTMEESESLQRLLKDKRGSAVLNFKGDALNEMERKTTITDTALGFMTTGVLPIGRDPGIVPEARQVLKVRNVLSSRPTTFAVVDFVKVNTPMSIASPQTEGSAKAENQLTFTSVSEKIRTLATWIPASRQALDDMGELRGFIYSSLPYYLNKAEELQLLSGDDTGENLHGLIPQAVSFNTGLLVNGAGWNKIDIIGKSIQQINQLNELDPTFVIMNPKDWWDIRLQKDGFGRYILGDPQMIARPNLFGLDVVYTNSIASGTFLTGSGSPIASEILDKMDMVVEISTEHSTYFTQNLLAIRAEKRLALLDKRPSSYVTGTFTTSP
jgi:HK97 family phage major capsid protein